MGRTFLRTVTREVGILPHRRSEWFELYGTNQSAIGRVFEVSGPLPIIDVWFSDPGVLEF
jgi:hypothetical protein